MNPYTNAKTIFDFYMSQLQKESSKQENIFALQYANLKLLRLRTEGILNGLYSYDIKVEK